MCFFVFAFFKSTLPIQPSFFQSDPVCQTEDFSYSYTYFVYRLIEMNLYVKENNIRKISPQSGFEPQTSWIAAHDSYR